MKTDKSMGNKGKTEEEDIDLSTITSASLADSKPFVVTPPKPTTEAAGLAGTIDANAQAFTTDLAKRAADTAKVKDASLGAYLKNSIASKGQVALTADEYAKEGGVDTLEAELTDINQQIIAEQVARRRAVEAIQKQGGGLESGQNIEIRRVENESIAREADLSVIQLARQGKYNSAKTIADRAVAAKLETQKTLNDALKFNYEENKSLFTLAEQRSFESAQSDRERVLNRQEDELKAINDLALNALQNGAPTAVVQAMQKATTRSEAQGIGGEFVDRLDRRLKEAQISNAYADINAKNAEALAAGNKANFTTPPIINPDTGRPDPLGNLSSVIALTGGKDNVNLQNAAGVIAGLQTFAERNKDGSFPGTGVFGGGFNATKNPEGKTNEADLQAIELKVQQWASGASLTKEQTAMVAKLTPKVGDLPGQIKSKTNALTNYMLGQASGTLATQGISYKPDPVDYFSVNEDEVLDTYLNTVDSVLLDPTNLYQTAGYKL